MRLEYKQAVIGVCILRKDIGLYYNLTLTHATLNHNM